MLKEKILEYLIAKKGATGGEMAKILGVSRTAVWKCINSLKDEGYIIFAHKNSGYTLSEQNDLLSVGGIKSRLSAKVLGCDIEHLLSVSSTNSYLKGLPLSQLTEGYTVIADMQSAGRGRMGRMFFSPEREGLYISFLLKPSIDTSDVQLITVCAALAVSRALDNLLGIKTGIKWVNDIYYGGKKLCGILTEATFTAELNKIESVIVGIGINTGKVPDEVKDIATSICEIIGRKGVREELAAALINEMETVYISLAELSEKNFLINEYRERLFIIGKKVMINNFIDIYPATIKGIDQNASLIIITEDGKTQTLRSGEISLIL